MKVMERDILKIRVFLQNVLETNLESFLKKNFLKDVNEENWYINFFRSLLFRILKRYQKYILNFA